MTGKTPGEHKGDESKVIDITSRLPILTPEQERRKPDEGGPINIVQFTKKMIQDTMTPNEREESKKLEKKLNTLYLRLHENIQTFDTIYNQLGYIPTDLSAWENNNHQIFTEVASLKGYRGGICSETRSICETTGDYLYTRGILQANSDTTPQERISILTIETYKGIETKKMKDNDIPDIPDIRYKGVNKFTITLTHYKQQSLSKTRILVHLGLYDEMGNLQEILNLTNISEKKIIELCYMQAIETVQVLIHQLTSYINQK
ncbi:MAG: hypothetical protein U0518_05085 [Candidatus Gracilibacteria bacterium]